MKYLDRLIIHTNTLVSDDENRRKHNALVEIVDKLMALEPTEFFNVREALDVIERNSL